MKKSISFLLVLIALNVTIPAQSMLLTRRSTQFSKVTVENNKNLKTKKQNKYKNNDNKKYHQSFDSKSFNDSLKSGYKKFSLFGFAGLTGLTGLVSTFYEWWNEKVENHINFKIKSYNRYNHFTEETTEEVNISIKKGKYNIGECKVTFINKGPQPHAYISWIGINPKFQNQKLGSRLLNEVLYYIEKRGYKYVLLEAVHTKHVAGWYEKNGFKKISDEEFTEIERRHHPSLIPMKKTNTIISLEDIMIKKDPLIEWQSTGMTL